ncbi:MAG: HYR domain-containing protein [Saprospiraceae bacterium]|nr:HYR domain-containing protein [Saprospiraceae bacterium]
MTGCTSPTITNINRRLNYGCGATPFCYTSPTTNNTVNVLVPMNSMSIATVTPSLLSRCGKDENVQVTLTHTGGPNDILTGVKGKLNLPVGFVQLAVSGGGVSYVPGQDSISIPNLSPGGSVTFFARVRATCAVASGSYSFSFFAKNNAQPCIANNAHQVNTSFIPVQSADLSIPASAPGTLVPFAGGSYIITNTVSNGGNGAIDSVYYCVQVHPNATLTAITLAGMNIPLFSSSPTEICYIIDRTLIDAALGVGVPFSNANIPVVETWTFNSCSFPANDLMRNARFGCLGSTCGTSNLRATGVTFGDAVPEVAIAITSATRPACFVDNPSVVSIRVSNTGTAPLAQLVYTISAGNNAINVASIQIRDEIGNLVTDQTIDVTTSPAHCSGGVRTLRDTVRNVDIPAGSYVDIQYELIHNCACTSGCSTNDIYNSSLRINSYTENCGFRFNVDERVSTADFDAYINGYVEGTQDLFTSGSVQYTTTGMELDWFNGSFPNAYIETKFTLPQGIDYSPNSIVWTDPNGLIFPVASETYMDGAAGAPDMVIIRWNNAYRPAGFIFSGGNNFRFNVVSDCSERVVAGCSQFWDLNITAQTDLTIDPACTNCPTRCIWSNPVLVMRLHCPGPGPCSCEGMVFDNFQVERINFGIPDNNNDRTPNGAAINMALVERDRFITGDTLSALFEGTVASSGMTFSYGFAIVDLDHANFIPLTATVTILDNSTSTPFTCNAVPLTADFTNTRIIADFSPGALNALGCSIPGTFTFENDDNVTVNINYKVNDPFAGIQKLITVPTQFYLSNMPFGLGSVNQCNVRQDRVSQIGIQRERDMGSDNFGACDLPDFFVRERLYLGGISTDEFPYEIRQIGLPREFTFTKPSEFVHRADQLGIRLTQNINPGSTNIVNLTNGTVPSSFINIVGDQLVLNTEGYLNSLSDSRIPTDEGFTIDYFPRVQGSCKSLAGIYSYTFSQILGVDNELFGKDTLQVDAMTKTFEYLGGAQLVASASSNNVTICSASEDVNINVRNLTNFNAPNTFITLRSPSGGLVGFDLLDASNNMVITPLPFGIYPLGNIGPNGSKDVILRVRANNCMRDSLEFVAGWSCESYPTTLEEALCSDPSTVYFIPATSGINMNVLTPNVDVITDLCNEVTYEVEILSTNLGFLRDIYFQAQFAPNETYVANTIQMAYPSVSDGGSYINIPNPTPISGGFEMDVSTLNTYLNTVGLVGSKDLDSNKISLRFRTITSCNFASGSRARFLTNAFSSCGDPLSAISKTAARIRVTSEPPSFNVDLALGDLTLNACNNQQGLSVATMVLNSGSPSVNDSIKYILPPGIVYLPGSYTPISNAVLTPPLISTNGGIQTLSWPFRSGLGLGSTISFSIEVEAVDIGQLCTDYTIVVQAYSTINDMCGAQTCNVGIIAGEGTQTISIIKPKLKFQNLTGTLTLMPSPANQVKAVFNATLLNMGAALQAGSTINMDIYDDVDADGTLSTGDVFVVTVSGTNANVLLPNQTINLMGMGTFAAGVPSICSVIAVLDPQNTCTCDLETSFRFTPDIIVNMEKEPEVCSGATLAVGPSPTVGYDVEWISIDGSNLSLLSSTTTTPTNFSSENNTGSNQIIRYAIRTSAGNDCYVFDTIAITVFPNNMDVVSVQSCQGQSFSLPAATIGGTNYVWVPNTGLTFPGPDMRYAIITSVAPGLTTYSLTYTDANGCAASYNYDVTGIDCGTANTRIGDYVWFDVNGNGIQDMGELPIAGMIVNLYNANNGTIVSSTTTDAMGNYLFDFLPQGNYFVEFIPLNGFTFTTPNQGTQGTNSVANTTTGRSPNYFLPLDSETLYVDAGMNAMCNLDMNVNVGPCVVADASSLKRVVTVHLDWQNNVYTYPFIDGGDVITVNILGQDYTVPVSTVNGSHTFNIDWQPTTNTVVSATATFMNAPSCTDAINIGSFGPCTFDLALRKTIVTPTSPPYKYGDVLQYRIEVFNQGTIPAANINVIDYKPAGLEFVAAQNLDWFLNTNAYSEAFISGPILPGASTFIDIYYRIIMNSGNNNAWTNFAEITYAEDNMGNDRSNYDTDSTPDKNPNNDVGGQPDTANDNRLDGNGVDDEDDHDGASFNIFDLALTKTIATPPPYTFGQNIQFDITIYNQGNITANSFSIIDYIPSGYTFLPVNSPAWTLSGSNATRTIPNPLLPGTSVTIPIILRVVSAAPTQYTNIAEISSARDNNGMIVQDFDGGFDNNSSNDNGGQPDTASDDALNGNGTGMGGLAIGDEDNMDVARVSVPNISLNKSVVSINPASSGNVSNNDVTFALRIENTGNENLTMLTLSDDFISQFGGSFVRIVTMPSIFSSTATTNPVLNPAFNGGVNDEIFNGLTGNFAPTQNLVVRLTLELNDVNPADPLVNEAFTSGKDRFDSVVRDTAQAMVMLPNCFLQVNCPTPAQGNFNCAGDVPDAATTVATFNNTYGVNAIENFCTTPTITFVDAIAGLGCASSPQTITRTYTITDTGMAPIGSQSETCTVIYTVVDTIKPIFMTPPCDLILECGAASNTTAINTWLAMNGKSVAMDNCDQNVSVTSALVENINTCGNTTTRKYSFTATDDCGNSIVAFGNVILEDRIAPVLTLPTATNNVACNGNIATAVTNWINSASATDQCGGTVIITSAITNEIRDCNGVNTRIRRNYLFTATDNCGNATTGTATFTINDNTAPTIAAPANLTVACGQDIGAAVVDWLDNYTVTEACQTVTVRNNYTGILPNLCGGSQTVTWTVTDGCGATGSSSAMIVVSNDVTPPVFSNCPANITVNVDVDLCASNVVYSTPIATDCNNPVTVVRTSGIASGSIFPLGVSTIVFTATDRCGNTNTCSFTITVVDTDVPSISCPDNDVVVCTNGSCVWPSTTALNPIGIENCPGANVTYTIIGATTGSGNGNVPTNTNFALGTSTITYTITAANGQTASCSFNVVVNDCTAPVITCLTAQPVFECGSPTIEVDITAWLASASATDNCTTTPTETVTRVNTINQCGNTENRLYQITATDASGNSSQCFVEVSITDNTLPVITTAAANLTVQCDGNGNSDALINWLNTRGGAVATDAACGNELTWSNNFTGLSNGCGGTGSTTVIFTVSDACGNTITTTATFNIEDTTNPTITAPSAITLLCGSASNNAIVQGWLDSYRVSDACGNVTVTNNFTALPTTCVSGSNVVTITFTATDECGRTSTTTSTITLIDNQRPVIMTPPTDLILECGADNTASINAWVTARGNAVFTDNCDPTLTSTFVAGSAEPNCGRTTTTLYTLTATDDCGNSTVTYANLILLDRIAPVLTLPTAANSVNCSPSAAANTALETWLNSATATDQCQGTITSISKSLVNTVRSCTPTNGTNIASTYLFSVSDNCGNATTGTATFTINDNTAPTITAPANLTVACGQDIGAAVVDWLDNYTVTEACQSYTVSNNYTGIIPNLCGGSQTVTWTVTDGCGATGSSSAMIIVSNDVTLPVFSNCPANITVNVDVNLCASNVVYSTPIATDCNNPVTVVRTSGIASGSTFPLGVSTIVFTATDRCGNTSICSFTITVVDTDVPSISCPSNDVVVCTNGSCVWPSTTALNPIGIENCPGANVTYTITGATTGSGNGNVPTNTNFALGTSVVTYTITAANGQTASCSFNVVVNDCTAPVITCPTAQPVFECGSPTLEADISAWLASASATDNCTLTPTETVTRVNTINQCGNTEKRLYQITATDAAGNRSQCFVEVSITDNTSPIIATAAANLTVQCDGNGNSDALINWLNTNGGAVATDAACGNELTWSNNFTGLSNGCGEQEALQ